MSVRACVGVYIVLCNSKKIFKLNGKGKKVSHDILKGKVNHDLLVVEGPKAATRGGVNGSHKISFETFSTTVPKSPPNLQIKHRDVHDPNKWVDVP